MNQTYTNSSISSTTHPPPTRPTLDRVALDGTMWGLTSFIDGLSPEATFGQHLVYASSYLGPTVWTTMLGKRVCPNLYAVAVGDELVDAMVNRVVSRLYARTGLSSPMMEGGIDCTSTLVHVIRDPLVRPEKMATNPGARPEYHQRTVVDDGVRDKRVLIHQAATRHVFGGGDSRATSLVSAMAMAFRGDRLNSNLPYPQGARLTATGSHVSLLLHCESAALLSLPADLTSMCVLTALPEPPADLALELSYAADVVDTLVGDLREVLQARGELRLAAGASRILLGEHPEAVSSTTRLLLVKLALVYACLDGCSEINEQDAAAARAVVEYSAAVCQYAEAVVSLRDLSDRILKFLVERGPRTRSEIGRDLGGHMDAERITAALHDLERRGSARRAESARQPGRPGRSPECWVADQLYADAG